MADQTIEIKLILRDELTKQLEPLFAKMKQLDSGVSTSRARGELQALGRGVQIVHRELSTLARISLGGLIGGGAIAGLVAAGKALSDMASRGLQLRYTADALGTTTGVLNKFSDAMMGLGKSQEEGASGIQAASKALHELQVEGRQSSLFKQLESTGGETGKRLARELAAEMAGPRGMQGGLELAMRRMAGMRQESAAKFASVLGFGPGFGRQAARDYLEVLGQLPKRLELSHRQQLELAKANASLGISWDNIKTSLASSLVPMFAKLGETLDKFLQSPAGKEFTKQIEAWGAEMNAAVDAWLKGGGLDRAAAGLKETVGLLASGFKEADKVIQAMGLSWPAVIASLVGLKLLGPMLRTVGLGLRGLTPHVAVILALTAFLKDPKAALDKLRELREKNLESLREQEKKPGAREYDNPLDIPAHLFDILRELFKGNIDLLGGGAKPTSGEGSPKSDPERRADLDEKKRQTKELTRQFETAEYALEKLNDYLMPGGPEGGGGRSGYGPGGTANENLGAYAPPERYEGDAAAKFANVRHNNPGAMFPGSIANRFGSIGTQMLVPSKQYKIASFPTAVHGAAANMYLLQHSKDYVGQTVRTAVENWSSKLRHDVPGYDPNLKLTREMLNDPSFAIPFMKAVSGGESVGRYPMDHGQWQQAFEWAKQGAPGYGEAARGRQDLSEVERPSPVMSHLANRSAGARVNGSATIDIDVGGLNQPERDPDELFKPQPIGGTQQMQNITKQENNSLSFQ